MPAQREFISVSSQAIPQNGQEYVLYAKVWFFESQTSPVPFLMGSTYLYVSSRSIRLGNPPISHLLPTNVPCTASPHNLHDRHISSTHHPPNHIYLHHRLIEQRDCKCKRRRTTTTGQFQPQRWIPAMVWSISEAC